MANRRFGTSMDPAPSSEQDAAQQLEDGPSGFPSRLAAVIGGSSIRAFARRAGISDTFLRQCLSGRTEPTRTKLLAIADTGRVSVEWLATGYSYKPGDAVPALSGDIQPTVDRQWLETVIEIAEAALREHGTAVSPAKKARLIAALYENDAYRSLTPEQIGRVVHSAA